MAINFSEYTDFSKEQFEAIQASATEVSKQLQAIAAETTEYSKSRWKAARLSSRSSSA